MVLFHGLKKLSLSLVLVGNVFAQPTYTKPLASEVEERVSGSKTHLQKTEGGQLLWKSIKAHGGLGQWFSNGLLKFRWAYHMTDKGGLTKDTTQVVDTWSSRAVHEVNGGETPITFGWDGSKGWVSPRDAQLMTPPDFWALTPYYFVGVPHVLADPGTKHQRLSETLSFRGRDYLQVKVTYEPDTGETPDDYYIVLIDPDTYLVKGVRYIVTHPVVSGGKPPVEKLLTYEGWYKLSDVLFPTHHESFLMNGNEVGEKIRYAEASEAEFLGESNISFTAPE